MSDIIDRARAFAGRAHEGQLRQYTSLPYITHCEAVAAKVAEIGHGDDVIAAAWLHDSYEDAPKLVPPPVPHGHRSDGHRCEHGLEREHHSPTTPECPEAVSGYQGSRHHRQLLKLDEARPGASESVLREEADAVEGDGAGRQAADGPGVGDHWAVMSEMVERAARALYERDASVSSVRWNTWPFAAVRKQELYRQRVQIVMESMREPTEAMLRAMEHAGSDAYDDSAVWTAAIDEALK